MADAMIHIEYLRDGAFSGTSDIALTELYLLSLTVWKTARCTLLPQQREFLQALPKIAVYVNVNVDVNCLATN